ncbi:hypothetical protein RDI58_027285 [Solanum bulbocastanum]|uniref:Uncharacterized protein n=1 Tax=Solanum bulbocastanum TaxID=147425 RepID=A0AAN8SYJ4_SOLBU
MSKEVEDLRLNILYRSINSS